MKPCKEHWAAMRSKLEELGMSQFIAPSGKALHERMLADDPAERFEPLHGMLMSFLHRAVENHGLEVLGDRGENPEDGMKDNFEDEITPEGKTVKFNHICPLCLVRRNFDHHNTATGRCEDAQCKIQIKPGELPWDEMWIKSCGEFYYGEAKRLGKIKVN